MCDYEWTSLRSKMRRVQRDGFPPFPFALGERGSPEIMEVPLSSRTRRRCRMVARSSSLRWTELWLRLRSLPDGIFEPLELIQTQEPTSPSRTAASDEYRKRGRDSRSCCRACSRCRCSRAGNKSNVALTAPREDSRARVWHGWDRQHSTRNWFTSRGATRATFLQIPRSLSP